MKSLKELVKSFPVIKISGSLNLTISGVADNSQGVKPGNLFIAIKGMQVDAHKFIPEAIKKGAVAVIGEKDIKNLPVTYIRVKNARRVLAAASSWWYGNPSSKLKIIGITGTDGKTTTTNFVYQILRRSGKKVGMISTINAVIGRKKIDTGFHVTNPEPILLNKLLSEMVKDGCEYVCLEVTSHGLDQERVAGLRFIISAITNVTREHLDYHKSYNNYLKTKAKIFKMSDKVVLNKDHYSYKYLEKLAPKNFLISSKSQSYLSSKTIEKLLLKFPGNYNIENAALASNICRELGLSNEVINEALSSPELLEGRFERVATGKLFRVIVDFAHTPNALRNVLEVAKKVNPDGRIICVFGCAGERDPMKRSLMGEISTKLADISIFTSEDPRNEDINKIILEIVKGAKKNKAQEVKGNYFDNSNHRSNGQHVFLKIPERGEAIFFAINKVAQPKDMILLLGKGHEKSMSIKGIEYPWSDKKAAKEALKGKTLKINIINHKKHIHFMGIGGSGMVGVALLSAKNGYDVSGCDLEASTAYLQKTRNIGKISIGHNKNHLSGVDILVVSPAIWFLNKNHPEILAAKRKMPILTWQEFLGKYLHKDKEVISVTGTHGKSTTTALLSLVFEKAGFDPSSVVGASVKEWHANSIGGEGKIFITEADEFYDNFLNYYPEATIINNIEFDHPDYFKSEKQLLESYEKFIGNLRGKKILIVNQDSQGIKKCLSLINKKRLADINLIGYTMRKKPIIKISKSIRGTILSKGVNHTDFIVESEFLSLNNRYSLKIPGIHNVYNSLGIIGLSKIYGVEDSVIQKVFSSFNGISRRLELIGEKKSILVFDDYAHHPTAIRATIGAVKQSFPKRRLLLVVEPHSYSRTKSLLKDYAGVFVDAEKVIIGPIYRARDLHDFGVSGQSIVDFSHHKNCIYLDSLEKIKKEIREEVCSGDLILIMGAGQSYKWTRKIYDSL